MIIVIIAAAIIHGVLLLVGWFAIFFTSKKSADYRLKCMMIIRPITMTAVATIAAVRDHSIAFLVKSFQPIKLILSLTCPASKAAS